MSWVLLLGAIAAEVTATSALKQSAGFSRLVPSIIVAAGYVLSFVALAFALKRLQVSVAYAIWSGVGTAAIAVIGRYAFGESLSAVKLVGLALIIGGVLVLRLAGSQ